MALWAGDRDNLALVANSCTEPETMDIGGLTVYTLMITDEVGST